jgi:hypothetical protein
MDPADCSPSITNRIAIAPTLISSCVLVAIFSPPYVLDDRLETLRNASDHAGPRRERHRPGGRSGG